MVWIYVEQPARCTLCCPTYAAHSTARAMDDAHAMWSNLRGAKHVVQYTCSNIRGAIYVARSMVRNRCCAIYVVQPARCKLGCALYTVQYMARCLRGAIYAHSKLMRINLQIRY
eukprot:2365754-Pyramimonas_sp.AAC.1